MMGFSLGPLCTLAATSSLLSNVPKNVRFGGSTGAGATTGGGDRGGAGATLMTAGGRREGENTGRSRVADSRSNSIRPGELLATVADCGCEAACPAAPSIMLNEKHAASQTANDILPPQFLSFKNMTRQIYHI